MGLTLAHDRHRDKRGDLRLEEGGRSFEAAGMNREPPTSNVQHPTFKPRHASMFGVRCSVFDVSPLALLVITAVLLTGCGTTVPESKIAAPMQADLFNGRDLTGWKRSDFGGGSEPDVADGRLLVAMGAGLSGLTWTNTATLPMVNYEIALEAMKLDGSDFFCGLTFPVGTSHATLVVGGWGGGVVGLSSIDGLDASENETTKNLYLEPKRWFRISVRVTADRIVATLDDKVIADVETKGRKISLRHGEIDLSKPLGLATYQTSAAFRNITLKRLQ
jgi:hypothetical protein